MSHIISFFAIAGMFFVLFLLYCALDEFVHSEFLVRAFKKRQRIHLEEIRDNVFIVLDTAITEDEYKEVAKAWRIILEAVQKTQGDIVKAQEAQDGRANAG